MTDQHEAQHETADCTPECPVARTAAIIEGKWTTLIVRELLPGTKRFGEMQKALPGISPKVLTERLRMLEDQGLVARTVHPCVPPKTEYTLTPLGLELRGVIQAMAEYGMRLGNR
ncbi:winged helix-turn-helix transcriptional regulator [Azospirillum canadense]|uniref:winged helix-turn-helix transcriptional regulator n=1 Tax=Azospirillum canadense TaxID=403962 RepID=UPI0022273305|nr:helix-turn-helix domain-containing protein [Azospirillum canadense]MCW2237927.1 DNA-binding HxlR family transcriptional regulator [Azospirillum canadense]